MFDFNQCLYWFETMLLLLLTGCPFQRVHRFSSSQPFFYASLPLWKFWPLFCYHLWHLTRKEDFLWNRNWWKGTPAFPSCGAETWSWCCASGTWQQTCVSATGKEKRRKASGSVSASTECFPFWNSLQKTVKTLVVVQAANAKYFILVFQNYFLTPWSISKCYNLHSCQNHVQKIICKYTVHIICNTPSKIFKTFLIVYFKCTYLIRT